ncbi:uncharacterized protein GGS22DRAFT_45404 [Annulohypoxylon maeteangense]|uniref:uncharacterized protein n=1 Tax=Annulohypoxylon maeteangense TaxID=1927788 RepID=UPI00200748F0|nr:uncharacterized protein GGS22DRAFT_45404 [Annulohypoxylon maeteangense]KAI0882510.1 hypothetical protein GGS22DRAFT_45404 [Annulohypoxylon maeteangense]
MSRSLDKDLLAHLKADDPNRVYKDISMILADLPDDELLEIEFLGKSHPLESGVNYLRDGAAIAIPKLRLAQAFFVARQILQNYQDGSPREDSEVLAAAAVVLLMDSEHLTAANIRKRLLMSAIKTNRPDKLLRREKQFIDSLVTSRLHRHTKSPTLWSHRRWLLHLFATHNVPIDLKHDIKNVVVVAGIRHPRNYTAWNHARFLLDRCPGLADTLIVDVKEFCLKNHADISGWSFLIYVIGRLEDGETRHEVCSSILAEVLSIADSLRWTNISVWVFLRSVAASELINDQQFASFLTVNKKLVSITPKDSDQWGILDSARQWCENRRLLTVSNVAG